MNEIARLERLDYEAAQMRFDLQWETSFISQLINSGARLLCCFENYNKR